MELFGSVFINLSGVSGETLWCKIHSSGLDIFQYTNDNTKANSLIEYFFLSSTFLCAHTTM